MDLPMDANCVVQHRHAIESTRISSKCVVQHMGGGKHNPEVVPRCTNNMFCSVYMYAFLLTAYMFRQAKQAERSVAFVCEALVVLD